MSILAPITGLPGLRAAKTAVHKIVFRQGDWLSDLAGGKLIDGVNSRDPTNGTDTNVLQPGVLMGKITSSGLYAPSVLDVTQGVLTSTGTSLTLSAAGAAELARRVGASGTFTLTGPPTASGVNRSLTVTYSAVNTTTGVVTLTALGVNEVQTLNFQNSPVGTFTLTVVDLNGLPTTTPPITYSATAATLVSNINTALNTALGSSLVVASGTLVTAVALTFSGAGYTALPQTLVFVGTNELIAGNVSVNRTTAGVSGAFVSGSLVQPTDGSQTPLTLVPDGYGIVVTDTDNVTNLTVPFPQFPIAGVITEAQIVNWPADSSIKTYLRGSLSGAATGKFVFDGGY